MELLLRLVLEVSTEASGGGVPMVLSSGFGEISRRAGAVEGTSAEHGMDHVATAAWQIDDRGVVLLPFGALALVVGS